MDKYDYLPPKWALSWSSLRCFMPSHISVMSILVRDLLGLDMVLLHFPGHLATAVKFKSNVEGDFLDLDDGRYIVCDPTYIGAPVGLAMPEYKGGDVEVDVVKIK